MTCRGLVFHLRLTLWQCYVRDTGPLPVPHPDRSDPTLVNTTKLEIKSQELIYWIRSKVNGRKLSFVIQPHQLAVAGDIFQKRAS